MSRRENRLIFHVDVNSAYLSWEAARRVAEGGADLRSIPSAIGGDPEKRTGVILAKSVPAKAFQIKTGEPVGAALRKCPQLVLARPDFGLYHRCSRAFLAVCRRYAPVVEQFSIDECFLDMTGTEHLYPDPAAVARAIQTEIREKLGFTVNIGISSNKLLAKMASDFEKPDRVHTLFPEELPRKLWPLPVGALFSVGRATARRLEQAGIHSIGDLAQADLGRVQALLGKKLGQQLHRYANGVDSSRVTAEPEQAKEYSISTTLEEDLVSARQARPILLALADGVSARMRADGAKAFCVAVTIRTHAFRTRSHQKTLPEPTDVTAELYEIALELFHALWDGHTPLRLLGIALSRVTREAYEQATLFPDEKRAKARKIDQTVDQIRSRYGAGTIVRGGAVGVSGRVGKKYQVQLEEKKKR
jgi:DNA polymerase-4